MLIPLYGFLEGDTLGLLVLAHDEMTLAEVAAKLQASASVRVAPLDRVELVYKGRALDPRQTVADAGLEALSRVDVRRPR